MFSYNRRNLSWEGPGKLRFVPEFSAPWICFAVDMNRAQLANFEYNLKVIFSNLQLLCRICMYC